MPRDKVRDKVQMYADIGRIATALERIAASVALHEPESDVCDECGITYPETADTFPGPWHEKSCSLYVEIDN